MSTQGLPLNIIWHDICNFYDLHSHTWTLKCPINIDFRGYNSPFFQTQDSLYLEFYGLQYYI